MLKLKRFWGWLLPELIYLDPMVASAFGQALVENQGSHGSVRRLASVSEAPLQRRAAAQLMLASIGSSELSRGSGRARL